MARRLSFSIAQPITILGWYITSVLLIALISTTSVGLELAPGQSRALTEAFYYAIMAAALYFVLATLMTFNLYGAYKGHFPKEFKLTISQRTLMLQTISFMVYMLCGAAVYARVENWKFLDAMYWSDFTLLAVGFGDFTPLTHLGRSLLFPFAIGGLVILGLVVTSIVSMVFKSGKRQLGSRLIEKERERVLQRVDVEGRASKSSAPSKDEQARMPGTDMQKEEFLLMRKIQKQALTRQKWTALLLAVGAWFFLLIIGAVVFYKSERNQGWTYFQSCNSGKPFFVFWSLLAVPTLTILISNMSDTVIKVIRDLMIYLGELTVLPSTISTQDRLKRRVYKLRNGKYSGPVMGEPSRASEKNSEKDRGNQNLLGRAAADDRVRSLENAEQVEANAANAQGDEIDRDTHTYHFRLIRALRMVQNDLIESPRRKYTYEEWAWFLSLMGEVNSPHSSHRSASIQVNGDEHKRTNDRDGRRQWSWVDHRSPLTGETEEAVWILEGLTATLERELKRQSKSHKIAAAETPGGNMDVVTNDGVQR
ncbi:Potassium channel [Pseudocyphellaria aurata]|nr:Potassium channel [Pseudocyphellaria aurata]